MSGNRTFLRYGVSLLVAWGLSLPGLSLASQDSPVENYPASKRVSVEDTYHGKKISDPYRWLENLSSGETQAWLKAQDELTTRLLQSVSSYGALRDRIAAMQDFTRYLRVIPRGNRYFIIQAAGGGSGPPSLLVQEGEEGEPHLLLDSQHLFPDGSFELAGVFPFWPSPDGKFVAYAFSRPGSRWMRVRVLDVATKKPLAETLSGLHRTFGGVAWRADDKGFFYVRVPEPPQQEEQQASVGKAELFYHAVGTPQADDLLVYGNETRDDLALSAAVTQDGRYLVVTWSNGSDPGNGILYKELGGSDEELGELIGDALHRFRFLGNRGSTFWFHTNFRAPRGRVLAIDVSQPQQENWTEVIPERKESISYVSLAAGRFIVMYSKDARPLAKVFQLTGEFEDDLPLPSLGMVWGPPWGPGFTGGQNDSEAFFNLSGLADPGTLYRFIPRTGRVSRFFRPELPFDPDDFITTHTTYPSKDGTRVPIFIAHKRGVKPGGQTPLFLYGYGAFGWSAFPWYQPQIVAWMEMGGVYALAGIRGGGEYGEEWHQAGIKLNKQKAVEDYIAAAEWLVENEYTTKEKLVANGGSASGPLVGAALTQRPNLFGAVLIDIPLLDMVRYEESGIGSLWVSEFGSISDPKEFRALLDYSPYHNLEPGTCYPPILVTAGERDETALPWHAAKFTAALQHIEDCGHLALLQIVWGAGHTLGTSRHQSAKIYARQLAFLAEVLGLEAMVRTKEAAAR